MSRQCDVKHLRDDDSVGAYFQIPTTPEFLKSILKPGSFTRVTSS